MTELLQPYYPALSLLAIELMALLLLIVLGALVYLIRHGKSQSHAANEFVKRLAHGETHRRDKLRELLAQNFGLDGDDLEEKVADFVYKENAFYKTLLAVYLSKDPAVLNKAYAEASNVMADWGEMVPEGIVDEEEVQKLTEDLMQLQSEHDRISGELKANQDEMEALINEYNAAFKKGKEKEAMLAAEQKAAEDESTAADEATPASDDEEITVADEAVDQDAEAPAAETDQTTDDESGDDVDMDSMLTDDETEQPAADSDTDEPVTETATSDVSGDDSEQDVPDTSATAAENPEPVADEVADDTAAEIQSADSTEAQPGEVADTDQPATETSLEGQATDASQDEQTDDTAVNPDEILAMAAAASPSEAGNGKTETSADSPAQEADNTKAVADGQAQAPASQAEDPEVTDAEPEDDDSLDDLDDMDDIDALLDLAPEAPQAEPESRETAAQDDNDPLDLTHSDFGDDEADTEPDEEGMGLNTLLAAQPVTPVAGKGRSQTDTLIDNLDFDLGKPAEENEILDITSANSGDSEPADNEVLDITRQS